MTEEDFLRRWSRRKREVAKAEAEPRVEAEPPREESKPEVTPKREPEFDIATLPPIESINGLTDITAFLRAGVPEELTRAALRRVWTADPSIRDFVGLAENAWDFTDPDAMPGFGPLGSTDEVRRMVAQIVDQIGQAAQSAAAQEQSPSKSKEVGEVGPVDERMQVVNASEVAPDTPAAALDSGAPVQSNNDVIAPQHDLEEGERAPEQVTRRIHGGALPR